MRHILEVGTYRKKQAKAGYGRELIYNSWPTRVSEGRQWREMFKKHEGLKMWGEKREGHWRERLSG